MTNDVDVNQNVVFATPLPVPPSTLKRSARRILKCVVLLDPRALDETKTISATSLGLQSLIIQNGANGEGEGEGARPAC